MTCGSDDSNFYDCTFTAVGGNASFYGETAFVRFKCHHCGATFTNCFMLPSADAVGVEVKA
jgi:transposase-like protein